MKNLLNIFASEQGVLKLKVRSLFYNFRLLPEQEACG